MCDYCLENDSFDAMLAMEENMFFDCVMSMLDDSFLLRQQIDTIGDMFEPIVDRLILRTHKEKMQAKEGKEQRQQNRAALAFNRRRI